MGLGKPSDVAIVGAGPAGVSAAVTLRRSGVSALLIEREEVGGLVLNANLVEDYPGFPEGVRGKELGKRFERQLSRLGIKTIHDNVVEISRKGEVFHLKGERSGYKAEAVILATGTLPLALSVPGAKGNLLYEVKGLRRGKGPVAVIGGGEAALDYALTLARLGYKVTVLCRRVKAVRALAERVSAEKRIRVIEGVEVDMLARRQGRLAVSCKGGGRHVVDLALCAVGRAPRYPAFGGGFPETITLRTDCSTSVPGLFLAGDMRRGRDRHVTTAVADGMAAALLAMHHLGVRGR